jgi:hypothetical protein
MPQRLIRGTVEAHVQDMEIHPGAIERLIVEPWRLTIVL